MVNKSNRKLYFIVHEEFYELRWRKVNKISWQLNERKKKLQFHQAKQESLEYYEWQQKGYKKIEITKCNKLLKHVERLLMSCLSSFHSSMTWDDSPKKRCHSINCLYSKLIVITFKLKMLKYDKCCNLTLSFIRFALSFNKKKRGWHLFYLHF